MHVYDVATGKALADVVPRVNGGTGGGSVAWVRRATAHCTRYVQPEGERSAADPDLLPADLLPRARDPGRPRSLRDRQRISAHCRDGPHLEPRRQVHPRDRVQWRRRGIRPLRPRAEQDVDAGGRLRRPRASPRLRRRRPLPSSRKDAPHGRILRSRPCPRFARQGHRSRRGRPTR